MKYVATISFTAQVSPDDWALVSKHLEVSPATTVQEILHWMKKHHQKAESFVVREMESKS